MQRSNFLQETKLEFLSPKSFLVAGEREKLCFKELLKSLRMNWTWNELLEK